MGQAPFFSAMVAAELGLGQEDGLGDLLYSLSFLFLYFLDDERRDSIFMKFLLEATVHPSIKQSY